MTDRVPQALVTLSPTGELQIELPDRKIVPLTKANAGQLLSRLLLAQKAKIEGEAQERRAERQHSAQPDFYVIAKHPMVEIRQMLPGRGLDTREQGVKHKSLEDLGL